MLPLVAAAASVLIGGGSKNKVAPSSSTGAINSFANGSQIFFFGVVTGVSIGTYIIAEARRSRLRERMRRSYRAWLKSLSNSNNLDTVTDGDHDDNSGDDSSNALSHLSVPAPALDITGTDIGEAAILRILADPDTTLTSSLHASLVTLSPGTKMRPRESRGVELYYILQGVCTLWRDGQDEHCMPKGDAVVINPWSVRCMSNKGREDLVFLRVSDGGASYNEEGYDIVGVGEMNPPTTSELLASGINTVTSMLRRNNEKEDDDKPK